MAIETCNKRALLAGAILLALLGWFAAVGLLSQVGGPTRTWAQAPSQKMHVILAGPHSSVLAMNWPEGALLSLVIEDSTGVLYTETGYVDSPDPGGAITQHWFAEDFPISRGDTVSISGAGITKTHVVTELTLDWVDIAADIVYGTSPTAVEVCVDIWIWPEPPVSRCSNVVNGEWAVDFSGVCDIQETTYLGAFEFDDDEDATQVDWRVLDAVDALRVLQFVAGLPGGIGRDIDGDGDIDAVDALKILRFVAGLPVSLTDPCPDIGDGL